MCPASNHRMWEVNVSDNSVSERPDEQSVEHPLKGRFDLARAEWQAPAGGGNVQVAFVDDLIGMRNGDDPDGPILIFTEDEWDAFVLGAKDGEFDPEAFDEPVPDSAGDGG